MGSIGFTVACKKYFGQLPGQTLQEFAKELALLTPQDKADMVPGLSSELGETVLTASK